MKEQKSLEHRAWDILAKKLKNACAGNKSMDRNIKEKMEWAMKEAKGE